MSTGFYGPCRGIQANMEQTSMLKGLDHCPDRAGKGTAARHAVHDGRARSPAEAARHG
jgi:hypothetical protein